mmetsp:Transcript_27622/g.28025  ORF Transcript_27622/g.28025 Transcript_27622/m.28025 type:complete len:89 (-) Transcript_27622:278-544(-)
MVMVRPPVTVSTLVCAHPGSWCQRLLAHGAAATRQWREPNPHHAITSYGGKRRGERVGKKIPIVRPHPIMGNEVKRRRDGMGNEIPIV